METVHLLHTAWHKGRESFTIAELELLIGKIGRAGQGFHPVFHLIPMLHASYVFALRENNEFLISTSSGYRKLVKKVQHKTKTEDDKRKIIFAVGQTARKAHSYKRMHYEYITTFQTTILANLRR